MEEAAESACAIAIGEADRETARVLARAVREAAAELLPFGLEPQDFEAALERLAEPAAGEQP